MSWGDTNNHYNIYWRDANTRELIAVWQNMPTIPQQLMKDEDRYAEIRKADDPKYMKFLWRGNLYSKFPKALRGLNDE